MSALHPNGQKVDVFYEITCGNEPERHVRRGRLYGDYNGYGPVTLTVGQDRRVTFSESRVLYVEEVRSIREDS
jgi:hypothetical protein